MTGDEIRIFPLGDSALTVEFGRTISKELNSKAIALADHFQNNRFEGFVEAVPAYASTTIFYEPLSVMKAFGSEALAFDSVRSIVENATASLEDLRGTPARTIDIEAIFDGPDLELVAKFAATSANNVIDIFLARTYHVYMLGFLPGFTYMAEVDERIAMPRKESPRTSVPQGSIGIAGKQTGIYSLPSPGGWQLIGRTEVEMFSPNNDPPTLVLPGDQIEFVAR